MPQTERSPLIRLVRKVFFKLVALHPQIDRAVRYYNPRKYWNTRGGQTYFEEQEAVHDRTLRSQFITDEIRKLSFGSLLEVGCGYGKQLKNLLPKNVYLAGCDFSHPQLMKAKEYCPEIANRIAEADAESIPFLDKSFDAVFTSAVVLHNKHEKAQRIIAELIRVSRHYLIHNEDTDITFSRYGYDLTETYRRMNFKIVHSKQIPNAPDPSITQFTVAEIPAGAGPFKPEDIPLAYHKK